MSLGSFPKYMYFDSHIILQMSEEIYSEIDIGIKDIIPSQIL